MTRVCNIKLPHKDSKSPEVLQIEITLETSRTYPYGRLDIPRKRFQAIRRYSMRYP